MPVDTTCDNSEEFQTQAEVDGCMSPNHKLIIDLSANTESFATSVYTT